MAPNISVFFTIFVYCMGLIPESKPSIVLCIDSTVVFFYSGIQWLTFKIHTILGNIVLATFFLFFATFVLLL